ncbi:MAG: hypothetical protein HY885_12680 [Deltaproteobacteria bacterium]|nr:hypothetical protein [Deltaproteobacteria bacterium]
MIKGSYNDRLLDGQKKVRLDRGWRPNLIVAGCNRLLAALLKNEAGVGGILFLAVGEGLKEWDSTLAQPQPADSRLIKEILRRPIASEEILFLDSAGLPAAAPTGRLQISIQLTRDNFPANGFQPVREFGLFGGNATPEPDSGLMINHVIHPRIDITAGLTLRRTLRLDFAQGYAAKEEILGFGAGLPARSIDGVGDVYGRALAAAGVNVLADFPAMDPLAPLAGIPGVKLREFRAKARMVMAIRASLTLFTSLFHLSISELLRAKPEMLANMADSFTVTSDMAANLQEELMVLQVALDDEQLKKITLGSLLDLR